MYEMYPDWGPGCHSATSSGNSASSDSNQSVQAETDLRDNGRERPEDN